MSDWATTRNEGDKVNPEATEASEDTGTTPEAKAAAKEHRQMLKIESLRLAVEGRQPTASPEEILNAAKSFYAFVRT